MHGAAPAFHDTVEKHYHVIFFEVCITDRFNQLGYKTYGKVQALLLKAAMSQPYEEEMKFVLSFYGSDFDSLLLPTHLEVFSRAFQGRSSTSSSSSKYVTVSHYILSFVHLVK